MYTTYILNNNVNKFCGVIVVIVIQCIITTYFCINYDSVNRTVSGTPVAMESRIRPSGQTFGHP